MTGLPACARTTGTTTTRVPERRAGNSFEAVHRDGQRPSGNIDHAAIRVTDVEASTAFYSMIGPAAGLTLRRQGPDGATFSVGVSDGFLLLIADEPTGERPRRFFGR